MAKSEFAKSKKKVTVLSYEEQNKRIVDAGLELVKEANSKFSGSRLVTRRAANAVMNRALAKYEGESYSLRRIRTLKELNNYIQLAQHNKVFSGGVDNTDLLPIAHPRSTRKHELSTADLMRHRARWICDDPSIQDETVRSVLASALVSHPASSEYEYSIARLESLPQGSVPQYALLAALGDGNSSEARRARALRQRRDRKGRFAFMGGSMRLFVKRVSGIIQSLTGRVVAADKDSDTLDVELPNGKLIRTSSKNLENVKAVIKSLQSPDGYSKTPAKVKTGDPVLNEEDLQEIEAPAGFTKDESWSPEDSDVAYYGTKTDLGTKFTDDAYDVIKFETPNAPARDKFEAAQQRESEGQNVVVEGLGKNGSLDPNLPVYFIVRRGEDENRPFAVTQSWADAQDYIAQDEPKFEKGELPEPEKMLNDGAEAPEAATEAPAASTEPYELKPEPYTPKGAPKDVESGDYTDDPAEIAQKFDTPQIEEFLEKAIDGGNGTAQLPFEAGDEDVPAEALRDALDEKGENSGGILKKIYDKIKAKLGRKKKTEAEEATPEVPQAVEDALGEEIPEAPMPSADADPAKLPALLEGLSEEEKADYTQTGDYTKYLPKNKTDFDMPPQGYSEIGVEPFNKDLYPLPEGAPEGFTFDPLDIANNYDTEDLKNELRRGLEPSGDGYGILSQETETGEDYKGYVPIEAIRDALQLQGEDTNDFIEQIYEEGIAGQNNGQDVELTDEEISDALEGEDAETTEGTPAPEQAPAETTEPTPSDEAGPPTTPTASYNVGEPDGPAVVSAKAGDLKPGDVTLSDNFTIEKIYSDEESEAIKPGSVWAEGYYPGHQTQKTKLWNKDTEIAVYRNVEPPAKGDLPELSKPKPKEYDPEGKIYMDKELGVFVPKDAEARSKYLDMLDQYNKQLAEAQAKWTAPEGLSEKWYSDQESTPSVEVSNPVASVTVPASDVQAGDITYKKEWGAEGYEYFVVEENLGVDPETGQAKVKGFYPGHVSQEKSWNATTPITVMRGAQNLPTSGDKPALERPKKDDPDYKAKKAAFDKAKAESAATFTPPMDVENPQGAVVPPKKKAPNYPIFAGDKLKEILAQADGDPAKLKELLANETIVSFDFETAANKTKVFNEQKPIQIAVTKTKNGELVEEPLVLWMNPEVPLGKFYTDKTPEEILKDADGNPISDEWLAKQQSISEAFEKVAEYLGTEPVILMGHNISDFDIPILQRHMEEIGITPNIGGVIDTLPLARKLNTAESGNKLEEVYAKYFPGQSDLNWHDAETDVSILPDILNAMLDEAALTKNQSVIDDFDVDAAKKRYDEEYAEYLASKQKKDKVESEQIMADVWSKAQKDESFKPTVDELVEKVPVELPESDQLTSATNSSTEPTADKTYDVESVLGGYVSNAWVSDPENTTNIGKIAVEEWQPGDFIAAKHGGFFEIISIDQNPESDKEVFVIRRLLANGKIYGQEKAWIKYAGYEVWRRNSVPEVVEAEPTPELEQPQLETDETPKKEESAGTWEDYKISQGTDGVYYAENISASDVQKLRNGQLTPPNLPFFAPLGGGNNQETGEGYFFTTDGKRFWGKYGAAGALVRRKNSDGEYEYFLAKRSTGLSQGGGKWGIPGGAHKDQTMAKTPTATSKEEFMEEVGGDLTNLNPIFTDVNKVGTEWAYETDVYEVGPNQFNDLTSKDGENTATGWFTADQIKTMSEQGKLHPDFANSFPAIVSSLDVEEVQSPEKPTPAEEVLPEDVTASFDTSNWKKVAGQAGSNQGAFYVDPETGNQYYVKTPKSEKHAANEVLTGAFYEAAGTPFGRAYLGVDKKGKTVLVSPVVDGANPDFAEKKNDEAVKKNAQANFAVDAWLANYDAVGLAYDNMLTDKDGKVIRVDAGGGLLFRAQGKNKDFGDKVTEIDSMRDPDTNPQAADIFGGMTDDEIAESVKKVQAISEEKIDELVGAAFGPLGDAQTMDELKSKLKARRQDLIDRFLGGQAEETTAEEPKKPTVDANTVVLDVAGDLEAQIAAAQAAGKKVAFKYKGKERLVTPKGVWNNPQNGNVNLSAVDEDGVKKNYTLSNFEQSDMSGAPASEQPETKVTEIPEVELPQAPEAAQIDPVEKQKVLDEVSALAEKLFGSKGKTKDLLEDLKGQEGVNNDLIDSILEDINTPAAPADATTEEKIQSDIAQALTSDEDAPEEDVAPIDPEALAEELKAPLNPDLIWAKVKEEKGLSVIENGDIVVAENPLPSGKGTIYTMVKRNKDNTFSVYHRIKMEDGSTRVKALKGRWHSYTALESRIEAEKSKASAIPNKLLSASKSETLSSVTPSAIPTQKGAYVSADGKTPIKVGMVVKDTKTGATGKVISLKDELITKAGGKTYIYTDVAKVKWDNSGSKNWKVSTYLEIQDTSGVKPDEEGPFDGGSGGTPTPPPAPSTPAPAAPEPESTPEVTTPTFEGEDLAGATAIKDVEAKSVAKNSDGHLAAYGANNYSDYKQFLKGEFIKDPESKNLVPGILVQNDKPNTEDPELVSYGVVSKQDAKSGDIEVSYFDGPLTGKKQTLKADKVWSREKFITPEQAKELDIDIDQTLFDKSKAAAKAKGEAYAKEQEEKKKKAKAAAEAKALKAKFEVNGPGFTIQTLEEKPDFSKSPVDNAPSVKDALKMANNDNPKEAANGASVLVDADSIEDLEVHIGKVTDKDGQKKIRLQFSLTDWAAKALAATLKDDPNTTKSKSLQIDKWEKKSDGSLVWKDVWGNDYIDQNKNGVTYEGKAGNGTFKLHRASKDVDDDVNFFSYYSSSPYATAFHNKAEIYLPENATAEDVANALQEFGGVSQVRPATKDDLKGVIENKMIWLLGASTDGKKNFAGELRQKALDTIKEEYGFTADDVEVVVDPLARGRINYYMPESAVEKLMEKTGFTPYLVHNWKGGDQTNTVDWFYNVIMSGGIFATANRWMNGINKSGMSSTADVKAAGGNYVFTSPSTNGKSSSNSLAFYFDSRKVLRRLDYYKNNSDKYGQLQSEDLDIVEQLKNNYGELMFKKNLSWADIFSISMPAEIRKQLVERLLNEGQEDLANIVAGKKAKKGTKK